MFHYFNFHPMGEKLLLTNDFGRHIFLSPEEFRQLLRGQLSDTSEIYGRLKERLFVFEGHQEEFLTKAREPMRDSKSYLFSGTVLHIFVVTNRCNGSCVYCQAQDTSSCSHGDMTPEIARKAVDIALSSPSRHLSFEFQGGEPLLNFEVIRYIVEYTEANMGDKVVSFNLVSNLTLLTEKMLTFFLKHGVALSTSLDGPEPIHDWNRPLVNGQGTYQKTLSQVRRVRAVGGDIGAIQTTTRKSLACPKEIVDAYVANGFQSIFLRPLTPLGFAASHWEQIGYAPKEFIDFYRAAFHHILDLNRSGLLFVENHAAIFLHKILRGIGENYMELRSPCGAVLGQLAYYFDGNIYTCDEGRMLAEMGDASFCLGSVFSSNYNDLVDSSRCKAVCTASVTEALPECCDCVYQPYCGACPVVNLSMEHDIFPRSPFGYRCQIYRGMLDTIFEVLKREDSQDIKALEQWL